MRQAEIYVRDTLAGILAEDEDGYTFQYTADYLAVPDAISVSLTLPLAKEPYTNNVLFPFFDGLIPEGWLLDHARRKNNISDLDRMGYLLACCKDCIGTVSVVPINTEKEDEDE